MVFLDIKLFQKIFYWPNIYSQLQKKSLSFTSKISSDRAGQRVEGVRVRVLQQTGRVYQISVILERRPVLFTSALLQKSMYEHMYV